MFGFSARMNPDKHGSALKEPTMDTLIKVITAVVPFLAQCPPWVRLLAVGWVVITGVLIVVVLVCILWPPVPPPVDIVIMRPTPNEEVEEVAPVEFRSAYSGLNHYIIVIPMKSPDRWVVDGPLPVSPGGVGKGRARFGSGPIGVGELFEIEVMAGEMRPTDDVLANLPAGAHLSRPVTVKRVR